MDGVVVEVSVIRSVTICTSGVRLGDKMIWSGTYALVEGLALADEDDVTLYKVCVQCLDSC